MNRVIRGYPLRIDGEFQLDLPQTAQIVHVGMNGEDRPTLWANVDPSDEGLLRYSFEIVVTDRLFPIGDRYIGTFRFGSLMFHVIETQSPSSINPIAQNNATAAQPEVSWTHEDQAEADARIVAAYHRGEEARQRLIENGFTEDAEAVADLLGMVRAAEDALDNVDQGGDE